jgi:hypothetical protein
MKRSRQNIKENHLDLDSLSREFIMWAMGDGAHYGKNNPMWQLYEYYYEDNDQALLDVAEEFADANGYDIEEVYEAARKAANYYFHYNPVDLGESRQVSKKNTIRLTESELKQVISESVKKIIKEIGDTPRGQFALGALKGRAAARARYQNNKYGGMHQQAKLNQTMNNAADAAYQQRQGLDISKYREMDNAEQRGYYYGFDKGMTN